MAWRRAAAVAAALTLFVAGPAAAHEAPFGLTGLPGLLLHPFGLADEWLPLVGAGLLLGGRPGAGTGAALAALAAGIAAGGAAAIHGVPNSVAWGLPYASAALAGSATALAWRMPRWLALGLVGLIGAAVGIVAARGGGTTWEIAQLLAATAVSGVLFALLLAGLARLVTGWTGPVPLRIAGSWLAAIALLVSALVARTVL